MKGFRGSGFIDSPTLILDLPGLSPFPLFGGFNGLWTSGLGFRLKKLWALGV